MPVLQVCMEERLSPVTEVVFDVSAKACLADRQSAGFKMTVKVLQGTGDGDTGFPLEDREALGARSR